MPSFPIYKGYLGLIDTPTSGRIDIGERIYLTEEKRGLTVDAQFYANLHVRGSLWPFVSPLGTFCVEECHCAQERGGISTVTVKYVSLNSLPPDEWSLTSIEDNPPIEFSTFFSALTDNDRKLARGSFASDQMTGQATLDTAAAASANHVLIQSLLKKWLRGEETFYRASLKYTWTVSLTNISGVLFRRGGYIEDPGGPGFIPFNFSWLRLADQMVWNNGI